MAYARVCNLDELVDGKGQEFMVAGRVVAVFRNGTELHALDGMCAHQGGPIAQGRLDGKCITCPWHGWQYDIANGNNILTGKQLLDRFAIEIRNGEVWIDTEPST
jgi:nitrite reductase (NADH) small subunit